MTPFDFLLTLLSFVFALAIGHVLTSAGRLLVERHRVKFSGLLALAMLNALVTAFVSWLAMWSFRSVAGLNLFDIAMFFVSAILIYLNCMAASPEPNEGEIDMEAFFWAQRRLYYGTLFLLLLSFIASTIVFLRTNLPHLFFEQALSNVPFLAVTALAFFVRNRSVQWAVGILLLVATVGWSAFFNTTF